MTLLFLLITMIPRCNVCNFTSPATLQHRSSSLLPCQNHFLHLAMPSYADIPPFPPPSIRHAGPCLSTVQRAGLRFCLGVFFSFFFFLPFLIFPHLRVQSAPEIKKASRRVHLQCSSMIELIYKYGRSLSAISGLGWMWSLASEEVRRVRDA